MASTDGGSSQMQQCSRGRSSRSRSPTREERSTIPRSCPTKGQVTVQTDVIIPVGEKFMEEIATGKRNYIFRKASLKPSVQRIWFFRTVPHSSVDYICEILSGRTRTSTRSHSTIRNLGPNNFLPDEPPFDEPPLEEDGSIGNHEFNTHHHDWEGYDWAYKIFSVYELDDAIPLQQLKDRHGLRGPPRSMAYVPQSLMDRVELRRQPKLR